MENGVIRELVRLAKVDDESSSIWNDWRDKKMENLWEMVKDVIKVEEETLADKLTVKKELLLTKKKEARDKEEKEIVDKIY